MPFTQMSNTCPLRKWATRVATWRICPLRKWVTWLCDRCYSKTRVSQHVCVSLLHKRGEWGGRHLRKRWWVTRNVHKVMLLIRVRGICVMLLICVRCRSMVLSVWVRVAHLGASSYELKQKHICIYIHVCIYMARVHTHVYTHTCAVKNECTLAWTIALCHTCVMSHIWISHGTNMDESCRTCEFVVGHMRHVTHMSESCHTCQ